MGNFWRALRSERALSGAAPRLAWVALGAYALAPPAAVLLQSCAHDVDSGGRPAWLSAPEADLPCEPLAVGIGEAEVTNNVEAALSEARLLAMARTDAQLKGTSHRIVVSDTWSADADGDPAHLRPTRVYARAYACAGELMPASAIETHGDPPLPEPFHEPAELASDAGVLSPAPGADAALATAKSDAGPLEGTDGGRGLPGAGSAEATTGGDVQVALDAGAGG